MVPFWILGSANRTRNLVLIVVTFELLDTIGSNDHVSFQYDTWMMRALAKAGYEQSNLDREILQRKRRGWN